MIFGDFGKNPLLHQSVHLTISNYIPLEFSHSDVTLKFYVPWICQYMLTLIFVKEYLSSNASHFILTSSIFFWLSTP